MKSLSFQLEEQSIIVHHRPPVAGAGPMRRTRWGLAVGLAAAVLTGALFAVVTTPWISLPWALALVVLGPSSQRLDRRLALNLSLVIGLTPVALWVPTVLGARTAAVTVLAIGTGTAITAAIARPGSLLPVVRLRDGAVVLAGLLAGLVAFPLRSPGTPQRALAMLSTGIDNSYHFAMFLEQRLTTASSLLLAANADPSGFAFDDYPPWFHKLLTVLAQTGFGDPGTATTELVRFAELEWIVFTALAALVTAALLQALPDRVPASLLGLTLTILFSLLLGVPGALNLLQGHLSFLVAACAPLVMFLLAIPQGRPSAGLFVVLGGLVLTTASWLLLLPMAAAALLPPLLAVWRHQRVTVRWLTLAGVILVSATAFVLFVLGPLTHGGLMAVLRDGTVPKVGLPTMLLILVGSIVLIVRLSVRRRDVPLTRHLVLALAAFAQALVVGGYMLATAGQLTYYFWKLGLGSLIVAIVVATHAIVTVRVTANDTRPAQVTPIAAAAVVLVAAVGLGSALQNFGAPSLLWSVILPGSLEARATSGGGGDVDFVLRLATSMSPHDAARTRLLATRPQDMNPAHASEWFHALSHSSTRRAVSVDDGVYDLAPDRGNLALGVALAQGTLASEDGQVVVTDPALYTAIVDAVPAADKPRVLLVP